MAASEVRRPSGGTVQRSLGRQGGGWIQVQHARPLEPWSQDRREPVEAKSRLVCRPLPGRAAGRILSIRVGFNARGLRLDLVWALHQEMRGRAVHAQRGVRRRPLPARLHRGHHLHRRRSQEAGELHGHGRVDAHEQGRVRLGLLGLGLLGLELLEVCDAARGLQGRWRRLPRGLREVQRRRLFRPVRLRLLLDWGRRRHRGRDQLRRRNRRGPSHQPTADDPTPPSSCSTAAAVREHRRYQHPR